MKACIYTIYFPNIDPETVNAQRQVVNRFNVSRHRFYQFLVDPAVGHGGGIDRLIARSNVYNILLFLDLDCIPLSPKAIDYYLQRASEGVLIGNAQRSMHIQNNEHMFAAPSALAFSLETFEKIGEPSASPTPRGDVAEEFTYQAEAAHIPLELTMPSRCEKEMWSLGKGRPNYGSGTTFTHPTLGDLFWHNFQIWNMGQQENFQTKCASILEQ